MSCRSSCGGGGGSVFEGGEVLESGLSLKVGGELP